mgnify:CR=1 FL=1
MQNKDFFSGVPIEVREFLLRLLNLFPKQQLKFIHIFLYCISIISSVKKKAIAKRNSLRACLKNYSIHSSRIEAILSICSFVITSGGTILSTSLPAEITSSPFANAAFTTSPTGRPLITIPCMNPMPRLVSAHSCFSTSSSS